MNGRHETCNKEVLVQQIYQLEGDFAALSLLRFPLGVASNTIKNCVFSRPKFSKKQGGNLMFHETFHKSLYNGN